MGLSTQIATVNHRAPLHFLRGIPGLLGNNDRESLVDSRRGTPQVQTKDNKSPAAPRLAISFAGLADSHRQQEVAVQALLAGGNDHLDLLGPRSLVVVPA